MTGSNQHFTLKQKYFQTSYKLFKSQSPRASSKGDIEHVKQLKRQN